MFACFFCTKCDCYRDRDEVQYYNALANSNKSRGMVKTTDINNDSDEEDRTVAGTERRAQMALAGPKMEI